MSRFIFLQNIISQNDYYPFGMLMQGRTYKANMYRFGFNGKEKDDEWDNVTGSKLNFGARIYDSRLGRWLATEPLAKKYPYLSTYAFVANMPIIATDPDGRDIVFLNDKEAAQDQGHGAVLIGNEKDGWSYVSINGTRDKSISNWFGMSGESYSPDKGELITKKDGGIIYNLQEAINRANTFNKKHAPHHYESYIRIKTSTSEDNKVLIAAINAANHKYYSIAGHGNSCIDVMQESYKKLVEIRGFKRTFFNIPIT